MFLISSASPVDLSTEKSCRLRPDDVSVFCRYDDISTGIPRAKAPTRFEATKAKISILPVM